MGAVTDAGTAAAHGAPAAQQRPSVVRDSSLVVAIAVALVAGAALAVAARAGATPLLVVIAVLQAALAPAWVFGTAVPGRRGALVLAALASAGADVAVSVRPEGRLGVLLPVFGLAVSAMFVHQLMRGAARVQVVSSLSAISLLLIAEVCLPALLQLRHEFASGSVGAAGSTPAAVARAASSAASSAGGHVGEAVAAAVAGALVASFLLDMVLPVVRFDPEVSRGIPALAAAGVVGAALAYLIIGDRHELLSGRAAFVGAGLGALAGLLAVVTGFVLHSTAEPAAEPAGNPAADPAARPAVTSGLHAVLAALLPIFVLMPVAFLLCLAVRA